MNIGIYKHAFLMQHQDKFIPQTKNCDITRVHEYKILAVSLEDSIFKLDTNHLAFIAHDPAFTESEPVNFYGNNVLRRVYHYPNIDLFKIKANCNVADTYELRL